VSVGSGIGTDRTGLVRAGLRRAGPTIPRYFVPATGARGIRDKPGATTGRCISESSLGGFAVACLVAGRSKVYKSSAAAL